MTREHQEPMEPFESQGVTIGDLLDAISETEYPQYILDALTLVQDWMEETLSACSPDTSDSIEGLRSFPVAFESNEEEMATRIDKLFERLERLSDEVDIVPNISRPSGCPDAIIVNLTPFEGESGLRTAIDYGALFNRGNSKRIWIVSDTFVFEDIAHYGAHFDALLSQGVSLRFILVTPWGWVEMPLTGATASRQQFLWRSRIRGKQN